MSFSPQGSIVGTYWLSVPRVAECSLDQENAANVNLCLNQQCQVELTSAEHGAVYRQTWPQKDSIKPDRNDDFIMSMMSHCHPLFDTIAST